MSAATDATRWTAESDIRKMPTIATFWTKWQTAHSALESDATWLGSSGWTIPLWADPRIVKRLRSAPGDLDAAFGRHYTARNAANLRQLWAGLSASQGMRPWRRLLSEAVASYEDKRYAIVVPALLLIVEGAVAKGAGDLKRKAAPGASARRKSELTPEGMRRLIWASIHAFVRSTFRHAPFGELRPITLNRHWVLHGRPTVWGRRRECIRLFHALDTIAATVDRIW